MRVKIALQFLAPSCFNRDTDRVQNFVDAVDSIAADATTRIENRAQILSDLRLAIAFRKKHSKQFHNDGDEGHSYFVSVLNYCLQVIKGCRPSVAVSHGRDNTGSIDYTMKQEETQLGNAFSALALDLEEEEEDGEEAEEEEEEDNIDRPEPPQNRKSPPLSYYINSVPDSVHTNCFFGLLDFYMRKITNTCRLMKTIVRKIQTGTGDLASTMLMELASTGYTFSHVLKEVQRLEISLATECPHLDSTYKVLAAAFLPVKIGLIKERVREYSPKTNAKKFNNIMALTLVADWVKVVFQGGGFQEVDTTCKEFNKIWRLPDHWADTTRYLGEATCAHIMRISMTRMEEPVYHYKGGSIPALHPSYSGNEAHWFEKFDYLYGDGKSFLNTLKLLDLESSMRRCCTDGSPHIVFKCDLDLQMKLWNEVANPAKLMQGDLDATIVQALYAFPMGAWNEKFRRTKVPLEEDFLPIVSMAKAWIRVDTVSFKVIPEPIPFHVVFAIHALATSIYEVQGDGDVSRVAKIGQTCVENYISQLSISPIQEKQLGLEEKAVRKALINGIRGITDFEEISVCTKGHLTDFFLVPPVEAFQIAVCNPTSTAMILQHMFMGANASVGLNVLDERTRAKMVLHLYNALRKNHLVKDGIPYLSNLDQCLSGCKAIWNGWEKPEQGKFVYRMFLAMGIDHTSCNYQQDSAAFENVGAPQPPRVAIDYTPHIFISSRRRCKTYICASEALKSYQLTVLNDLTCCKSSDLPTEGQKILAERVMKVPEPYRDGELRLFYSLFYLSHDSFPLQTNLIVLGSLFDELLERLFPSSDEGLQSVRDVLLQRSNNRRIRENSAQLTDHGEELAKSMEKWHKTCAALGRLDYMEEIWKISLY